MYKSLGIHWASSIPAFLALACVPFPFLFYKYGKAIRMRCKYAAESAAFMAKIRGQQQGDEQNDDGSDASSSQEGGKDSEAQLELRKETVRRASAEREHAKLEREAEEEVEAIDYSFEDPNAPMPRFERIKTATERRGSEYDGNPYDIDRVNTRESFARSRSNSRPSSLKQTKSGRSVRSKR